MKSKILRETKVSSKNISRNDIEMGLIEHSDHKNAVHPVVFYFLIFISLGLPNLIFSGISWFDTLHLSEGYQLLCTVTNVPISR